MDGHTTPLIMESSIHCKWNMVLQDRARGFNLQRDLTASAKDALKASHPKCVDHVLGQPKWHHLWLLKCKALRVAHVHHKDCLRASLGQDSRLCWLSTLTLSRFNKICCLTLHGTVICSSRAHDTSSKRQCDAYLVKETGEVHVNSIARSGIYQNVLSMAVT